MSIELRPLGVACNLGCHYCYQNPQRRGGQRGARVRHRGDEAGRRARRAEPFTLFGGEPLLFPLDDLETLWSWGLEKFGRNGIQTNGALITTRTSICSAVQGDVGISIDGPGALNDVRWAGTLERTREATRRSRGAIERLCQAKVMRPSLIVTLHRHNATGDGCRRCTTGSATSTRLGIATSGCMCWRSRAPPSATALRSAREENVRALLGSPALERELDALRFDVFSDMEQLLLGRRRGGVVRLARLRSRTPRAPCAGSKGTASGATAAGRTRTASTS